MATAFDVVQKIAPLSNRSKPLLNQMTKQIFSCIKMIEQLLQRSRATLRVYFLQRVCAAR